MSSPAARKKAYRRRCAAGRIVLKVEIDEHQVAAAMIASGRLDERQALHRCELEAAVAGIVEQWVNSWACVPLIER